MKKQLVPMIIVALCVAAPSPASEPERVVHAIGDSGILRFHERTGELIDIWSGAGGGGTGLTIDASGFLYRFGLAAETFDGATGELLFHWEDPAFYIFGQADAGADGVAGMAYEVDDLDLFLGGCLGRMEDFAPTATACPDLWLFLPPGFSMRGTLGAIVAKSTLEIYVQDMPDGPLELADAFDVPWDPRRIDFGADGSLFITDSASPTVYRYELFSTQEPEPFLEAPAGPAGYIESGPDGALWLSNMTTRQILRYDEATGELLGLFAAHPEINAEIAFGDARVPAWGSSFEVLTGTLVSGGLDELMCKDDQFFVIAPDAALLTAVVHVTIDLPKDVVGHLDRIGINFEYACAEAPAVNAALYNIVSGKFDVVANALTPSSYNCEEFDFPAAGWSYRVDPPADYVDESGSVVVEITATRDEPFELRLDRLKLDYSVDSTPCAADCNADGVITVFDYFCFRGLLASGDPAADCNADGAINIFDFLCFHALVGVGCD